MKTAKEWIHARDEDGVPDEVLFEAIQRDAMEAMRQRVLSLPRTQTGLVDAGRVDRVDIQAIDIDEMLGEAKDA